MVPLIKIKLMENNIFFFGIIAVVLIVLIIFLVRQNQKDKEKLELSKIDYYLLLKSS